MHPARHVLALALSGLFAVALAACSAGSEPGWTFAPPPTVAPSAGPSGAASAAPSGAASAAPSVAPSAGPSGAASAAPSGAASAAPSGGTGGTILREVASGLNFQTTSLQAPANQPVQIAFDNQDASIQHNIQIADGSGAFVFEGDAVTGIAQITYNLPPLAAGAYKFSCKFHPTMIGDLTVQ